ncbi:MAG: hypothetical protein BWY91_03224 [bacterium ADurb.BinA028]|nr:MAG: hypothetical protein BWY91_03224 [bacterium ADurb.BinA028]
MIQGAAGRQMAVTPARTRNAKVSSRSVKSRDPSCRAIALVICGTMSAESRPPLMRT